MSEKGLEPMDDEVLNEKSQYITHVLGVTIASIGLLLAGLIIGIINLDATCDNGALMKLSIWVIIYCALLFVFDILFLVLGGLWKFHNKFWKIPYLIITVVYFLFIICWNIIGCISLFKDSGSCRDEVSSLWKISLVCLIFQWIGIIALIPFYRQMKKSTDNLLFY